MTPERYRRAGEIFDHAAGPSQEDREAYLNTVCADDPELLRSVLRLLASDRDTPGAFLAPKALELAARLLAHELSGGFAGTTIGTYRIGRQIDAGGMGAVYEARDLRLDRRVAVKLLPPVFLSEPERVERFRQEARAVSLLNHPNIVSIYDADQYEGQPYIATEFVEGKTLRQLIAEGPLDSAVILDLATQIASALVAAHDAGIVHRDIKPENVMVRPDGVVKVLDFGLAKLGGAFNSGEPTKLLTLPGNIVGTAQYLSPEQVLGKPVGPRSDLFSLGIVLYELAAGARPFDGSTDGAIFDAIVNRTPPPPSQVRSAVIPALDALIMRSLEKDPELRFQSVGELRSSLRYAARPSGSQPSLPVRSKSRRLAWVYVSIAIVVFGGLFAAWWYFGRSRTSLPVSFVRLTDELGEELFPNLSPDGKQFFYASSARGNWDIYLRRTGGANATNLTANSNADDTQPALSPNGSRIAFRSERDGGGIFVMEATGENPHRISNQGYYPAWSGKGDEIVYSDADFTNPGERGFPNSRLQIVHLASGAVRTIAPGDAVQPSWSPHGHRIAYWGISAGGQRDIFTVGSQGGAPVAVTNDPALDWNPVWSPSGDELYFISDRGGTMNLWRVRIDETSGEAKGEPQPVTVPAPYLRHINFARDAGMIAFAQSPQRVHLFFDRIRSPASKDRGKTRARRGRGDGRHQFLVFARWKTARARHCVRAAGRYLDHECGRLGEEASPL